jgi:molecular chaperone DnaK (HSP70)
MARIFGIDLGTTNSLIAVMEDGKPRVIADAASGKELLPSVVALAPDGKVLVGDEAIAMEPHLSVERDGRVSSVDFPGGESGAVVRSVKRYMGLGGAELAMRIAAATRSPMFPARWCASRWVPALTLRRRFRPKSCAR